jgi:hypothetical protein
VSELARRTIFKPKGGFLTSPPEEIRQVSRRFNEEVITKQSMAALNDLIAKSFGAEVTAVCSTRNLDGARSIGADHVIDYTQEDFTQNYGA